MRPNFYRRRFSPNFGISWTVFRRILILGLTVFLGFKVAGCFQQGLAWREASRLSVLAAEDLASNQPELARRNLSLALSLSPYHVEASRLAARLADSEGDSRALSYHETVLSSRGATLADWRSGAISAARAKNSDLALKWAGRVARMSADSAFPHLVLAEYHASRGDSVEQERELREALAQRESSETLDALAKFLLASQDSASLRSAEAASLLWKIGAIDQSPAGLEALRLGLSSGILDQDSVTLWLDAYRSHPASNPSASLFVDEIQLRLFPDTYNEVFKGIISRGLGLNPEERVPLARWLLQHDQPALVLQLLPLQDAERSAAAYQCWIDASIVLRKWKEIQTALDSSSNPLPPYQTQSFRAIQAGLMGDSAKSGALWREVMQNNRSRPAIFLELLACIARAGEWEIFYKELPALLNDPAWALKSVETLIPVARQFRDSTIMLDFYERTLKSRFLINEPLPKDRAAYTRLVLGKPVAIGELEARSKQYPENASYRITYAFGLLKSGSKVKSLFVLKDIEPEIQVSSLPPQQKAVFAQILLANGLTDEAQAILKSIISGSLTRQEESLLPPAASLKMAN